MDMEVSELGSNITCVRLSGRLDAPGADRIETRFTAAAVAPGRPAVIDLSGVSFVASMGIRLLLSSVRALKQKGATMVLFGVTPNVQAVFDDAALDQVLTIVATQALALERLGA